MRTQPKSLLILLATLALLAQSVCGGPLDGSIERIIKQADLGSASIAVHAIDLRTGAEIAAYRPEADMIPASNMKIITSGAALKVLGTDFVFRTTFSIDGSPATPRLIVKGSGDPAFGDPALLERPMVGLSLPKLFDQLAGVLEQGGYTTLSELVIDDRVFDRELVHPMWPTEQLNQWYCAEVGGLNLRRNVVTVYAEPTSDGGSPLTEILPEAPWIDLSNRAKTDRKGNNTAWVARPETNDRMTLFGVVRTRVEIDVSIHNPPLFAGRSLAHEFKARGIGFGDASLADAVRLAEAGDSFTDARPIAVVTTPLQDVLDRVNQDSHNLYAECLFKRLGHEVSGEPGSWSNGVSVVRMVLSDALGADFAKATTISDGSGMSRGNSVRPSTFTAWMRWLSQDSERWGMFKSSLAAPGVGTLRSRFSGDESLASDLAAKSGYLSGVYSLSGVLTHPSNGREIAFSILLNDVPSGRQARNAKPLQAAILKELDAYLTPTAQPADLGG
jgi:serine-type D-Ala-D-Ala carboxypeptidase/endopeptidase (penicillin-binding protein 4)